MATALTKNLSAQGTTSYSTTVKKFGTASMAGTGAFSGYSADVCPFGPNLYTIECWFYATAVPAATENLVVTGDTGNTHNFYISITTAGAVSCTFKDTGGTTRTLTYSTSVCDSTWHHLAMVFNTASATLFVDGVLQSTNANTPYSGTSNNIAIGSNTAHSTSFLQTNSYVDEVAFWNINKYTSNFTPNTSAYTGSEANLIHLYHLDSNLTDSNNPKVVFLTSGTSYSTPSDWTGYNSVEAIGAGGDGTASWGGGGAAYARASNLSLSGSISYQIGTHGGTTGSGTAPTANTWFQNVSTLVAAGGETNTGNGGATANSVGSNLAAGGSAYNGAGGAGGPNGAGGSRTSADGNAAAPGGAGDNGFGGAGGTTAGTAGGNGAEWTSNPGGTTAGSGGGGGTNFSNTNGNGGLYGGGGAGNFSGGTIGHGANGIIVITYVPASSGTTYSMPAASASYAVSDHSLAAGFGLGIASGSYALNPNNLTAGFGLVESSATYAFTPSSATLQLNGAHPYNLVISSGSYVLSEHALTPRLGIQCPAQSGSYSLTDSALTAGFGLTETSAAYTVSRHAAGTVFGRAMPAASAAYGLSPDLLAASLTWVNAPASYAVVRNSVLFNTSITKDILIKTIPYFVDVPVIYLVNDLNVIINYVNQSILFYAFSQSNLIKPFIMIPPDELNEALNLLVRAFNGVLDLLSWGQSYHLRYFSGVSAPELTLAVNTLIDEINGFTVSH